MKKIVAMLLACVMVISLAACGSENAESTTASLETTAVQTTVAQAASAQTKAAETTAAATTAATEEVKAEPDFLEILEFGNSGYQSGFDDGGSTSRVYEAIKDATNTEFNFTSNDADQTQIRIAGNDLGDFIVNITPANFSLLCESELLMPLNELVEQYAPEIITEYPELWEDMCNLYSEEPGTAYAFKVNVGSEGHSYRIDRYLYNVRWDLYKQLGCPDIKNPDDLINVLTDMVALEPVNEEGKKVYGASFYVTNKALTGLANWFSGTYGWYNKKSHYVHTNVKTNEISYSMTNEEGPVWAALEFYNKAYRAGILDPDCFTQKSADYSARITSGELLVPAYVADPGYEAAQLKNDPNSIKGYVSIPVEGCMMYANANFTTGWESMMMAIPKTCKNPEAVMRLIKFLYSEEGARILNTGIEGIDWEYDSNGVAKLTDDGFKMFVENGDTLKKSGAYQVWANCMCGKGKAEILSDGQPAGLCYSDDYFERLELTPATKEFSDFLGVKYPYQKFEELMSEGKMYDLSEFDPTPLPTIDEDISRIDTVCLQAFVEAIPSVVCAETPEAFEAAKQEVFKTLESNGAAEAEKYYKELWDSIKIK